MVSAMSVKLLMLNPAKYMKAKVPTNDKGTATLGISVAGILRKNRNITITTSTMANNNSNCTSCIEARMVTVLSVKGMTSILRGREAFILGNSSLILSTTSITLAPGWR